MTFKTFGYAGLAASLLAAPALAHHSFAMFDSNKLVVLDGTVTEFEWTNPHGWVHFITVGPEGKPLEYSIEMASVAQQARVGWKADSLKPGDKIKIEFNPLKDGTRGGNLVGVTLPSGQKLGHGGARNNPLGKD